tara:strand:+ start:113 stop:526 length:414 start_codon:yes stop_codon:yes gene_type:complete
MTIKIKATTKRINKSRKALDKYTDEVQAIIDRGSNMIRNTAVKSILEHGSTGVSYGKHTASLAGNPPNSDTGFLAGNIFIKMDNDRLGASIESLADYSASLEFGTVNMGARPFLQPAMEENRKPIRSMYKKVKARGI